MTALTRMTQTADQPPPGGDPTYGTFSTSTQDNGTTPDPAQPGVDNQ